MRLCGSFKKIVLELRKKIRSGSLCPVERDGIFIDKKWGNVNFSDGNGKGESFSMSGVGK